MKHLICINCGSNDIQRFRDISPQISKLKKIRKRKRKKLEKATKQKSMNSIDIRKICGYVIGLIYSAGGVWFISKYGSIAPSFLNLLIFLIVFLTLLSVVLSLIFYINSSIIERRIYKEIDNINQKIKIRSKLYFCNQCNQVMDLKTEVSDYPEHINNLVYKMLQKKLGK